MYKNGRLLIVSTILLNTFFIMLINQEIYLSENINDLKPFLPFINLVVFLLCGLAIFSIKTLEENTKKVIELNLFKTHLSQVEELLNVLQTQKHEHSRHMQTLQAMLCLDEKDKAIEYIEGIADSYRYAEKIVYVGHPAITALLNSKRKKAEAMKIDFAFSVKCNIAGINIPPWDLCSILGNLLDNAFDAAYQANEDRRAAIEIKYDNRCYVIYVCNTGPKIPEAVQKKLYTAGFTTKESVACGYGLYLVKKLLEKYGGKIDLLLEGRTTFIVYLPDRRKETNNEYYSEKNCRRSGSTVES